LQSGNGPCFPQHRVQPRTYKVVGSRMETGRRNEQARHAHAELRLAMAHADELVRRAEAVMLRSQKAYGTKV
jgi:hypothetical protein